MTNKDKMTSCKQKEKVTAIFSCSQILTRQEKENNNNKKIADI